VLVAALPLAASPGPSALDKIAACGPTGKQAWLCASVYDLTGSKGAADVADRFSAVFDVLLILLVAWLLVRLSRLFIRRMAKRLTRDSAGERIDNLRRRTGLALLDTSPVPNVRRALRAETIGLVLRSVVTAIIWATAVIMILDRLGVNLAAIGLGASIIGVAIGFGSQSLVRDFLSGLFMLIEDQYGVGDVIDVGEASGTVEGVSLRTTRLRDAEGVVWHVPNGEIRRVGNKSQQWARALLDIAVSYEADVEEAERVIQDAADGVWRDPTFGRVILGEPEIWGVERITADRVLIRLAVKTRPLEQWRIQRELRARIKSALDAAGIRPTGGDVVTYHQEETR
jgi:moderate conductance mechanosensitive channel